MVAQLALTPMLLAGAGLMMRSIIAQHDIDPGVRTAGLVRMRLELAGPAYESPADRARFYRQLEDRLADASDVRATLASHAPFEGAFLRRLSIDGRAVDESGGPALVRMMTVGRSYFDVLGTAPVRGSGLTASNANRELTAAIVNEQFASVYFGSRDPLGHRLALADRDGRAEDVEIVGVAPNIRQSSTEAQVAIDPIVYVAYAANPVAAANILVRSNAAPGAVAAAVARQVQAIDRDLPLYDVMTLDDSLALSDERLGSACLRHDLHSRRRHRPAAGDAGSLRRHRLCHRTTHARDRHSRRPGVASVADRLARRCAGRAPTRARPLDRHGRRDRDQSAAARSPHWNRERGLRHARRHGAAPGGRDGDRVGDSGQACDAPQSRRGAAERLMRTLLSRIRALVPATEAGRTARRRSAGASGRARRGVHAARRNAASRRDVRPGAPSAEWSR